MNTWKERLAALGCVVIIPTFNNCKTIHRVIDEVTFYSHDIILVNDGSTDDTLKLLDGRKDIDILSYRENRGKGYALRAGLRRALTLGYRYAITIDSDGQHFADDIPVFITQIELTPDAFLIGARNFNVENMPGKNTFANNFSNFWFKVETGITLTDTQSGYRLYPVKRLGKMHFITSGYEFELEVLVRSAWRGIPVMNVPVRVYYPDARERISHFKPFRDFSRISILNSFLVMMALFYYYPLKIIRAFSWHNLKMFLRNHIIHSKESDLKISLSVSLGIFFGIVPIWGYQMLAAGISAHLLRLNKVIAVAFSNISIPPMIPVILYSSVHLGGLILDQPALISLNNITFESVKDSLAQYVVGSFALAAAGGMGIGSITYILLQIKKRLLILNNE